MIGFATLHFAWHSENNPLGGLPMWLLVVLFVLRGNVGIGGHEYAGCQTASRAQKNASPA